MLAALAGFVTPPSAVAQRNASNEAIDAALLALPEQDRMVIHWRLRDDLSFVEIGSRLGVSRTSPPASVMGVRS